jgi:SAM-dependent methyltransferase
MIYQHPLAYLLGLEGVALLRTFAGEYDREHGAARIAEIRRLLDAAELAGDGVEVASVDTVDGYRIWSRTYDEPGNGLFGVDEPLVHAILDELPAGKALDAACGTGRYAAQLADRGHRVIGVDSSEDMLVRARARVPGGHFELGELQRLPVPDGHVDLVVCALALTHVPDLKPVFAEFARVLRPGGHLITVDVHHEWVAFGSVPQVAVADGGPALMPAPRHRASDYLAAALPVGLQVRGCREPRMSVGDPTASMPERIEPGSWDGWPWTLMELVPGALSAAIEGTPVEIIWHFQRPDR